MEWENRGLLGYPEEYYEDSVIAPDFFVDLNLDQIAAQIMDERKEYDLRKYFYRMPGDCSVTKARQEVLKAFGRTELLEAAMDFSSCMQCARKYAASYQNSESELQRRKFLLDCGAQYVFAVEGFAKVLEGQVWEKEAAGWSGNSVQNGKAAGQSGDSVQERGTAGWSDDSVQNGKAAGQSGDSVRERGTAGQSGDLVQGGKTAGLLGAFAAKLCAYVQGERFQVFRKETVELSEEFEHMTFQVEFANRRLRVLPQEKKADYIDHLRALFPEYASSGQAARGMLENPFHGERALGELEFFVLTLCQKKYPESFERLRQYEQKYSVWKERELTTQERAKGLDEKVRAADFLEEWLLDAERQLQVYLALQLFMKKIEKAGYPLVYADFCETEEGEDGACLLELKSSYDLALLLKQMFYKKPVVCNDAYYKGQERFLVVTGPNQGGKTTFARSLGQIVYFAKMGFAAPCSYAYMPYFDGLLTHFSVEESLETGRGKLKEELVRLEPMMHGKEGKSFVILNELFTTAATYDAYIMGRRVMEHFMGQGCYGVYVTHIQELASERAQVTADGMGVGEESALLSGDAVTDGTGAGEESALLPGDAVADGTGLEQNTLVREREAPEKLVNAVQGNTTPYEKSAPATGRVVSMAACVDEKDAHIRTYRIVRRKAEGVGYAYGLVEKYHLTYPELKKRIGERLGHTQM